MQKTSGNLISFNSTGKSNEYTDTYSIFNARVESFLSGRTYETFGSTEARLDLYKSFFTNVTDSSINTLQNSINSVLLASFPEIDQDSITVTNTYNSNGMIGYTVNYKLLDTYLTAQGLI